MMKLVVIGAAGKMGGRIIANAAKDSQIRVVGAIEALGNPALGKTVEGVPVTADLKEALAKADTAIDFSFFEATVSNLKMASGLKKPMVIGTTGHSAEQKKEIEKLARETAIVFSPNMSVMVNVMWKLLGIAVLALKDRAGISVEETHHAGKKDKPSGTALEILRVLNTPGLEVTSKRIGEVVGDHTTSRSGRLTTVYLVRVLQTLNPYQADLRV